MLSSLVSQGIGGCSVAVPVVGLDVGVSEVPVAEFAPDDEEVSGAGLDAERVRFFAV